MALALSLRGRRSRGAAGIIRAKLQLRLVVVPAPLAFLWLPLLLQRSRGGLLPRFGSAAELRVAVQLRPPALQGDTS